MTNKLTKRSATRAGRWAIAAMLGAATLSISGCQLIAIFMAAFPEHTKPVYALKDRPTLIMVEDPDNQLPDPTLAGVIAVQIYRDFDKNHVVKTLVDPDKLHELMETQGDGFMTMPVDRIGKELDAQQVFHVDVESVDLNAQGESIMPTMRLRVKIVDVAKGRLFPPAGDFEADDASISKRGYLVMEKLPARITSDASPSEGSMALRKLAERLGTETAQLFYSHEPAMPPSLRDQEISSEFRVQSSELKTFKAARTSLVVNVPTQNSELPHAHPPPDRRPKPAGQPYHAGAAQ